jgi:hypothetical protein
VTALQAFRFVACAGGLLIVYAILAAIFTTNLPK